MFLFLGVLGAFILDLDFLPPVHSTIVCALLSCKGHHTQPLKPNGNEKDTWQDYQLFWPVIDLKEILQNKSFDDFIISCFTHTTVGRRSDEHWSHTTKVMWLETPASSICNGDTEHALISEDSTDNEYLPWTEMECSTTTLIRDPANNITQLPNPANIRFYPTLPITVYTLDKNINPRLDCNQQTGTSSPAYVRMYDVQLMGINVPFVGSGNCNLTDIYFNHVITYLHSGLPIAEFGVSIRSSNVLLVVVVFVIYKATLMPHSANFDQHWLLDAAKENGPSLIPSAHYTKNTNGM
ncbi:hypothetical protein C0J52_27249 [Blattella germanica]|nr:hypothetical protein C0J52_27249 [Blattella germanica]